jgi:tetratricopeptide (TPR) repeat protein
MNRAKRDSSKRKDLDASEPDRIKSHAPLLKELAWLGSVGALVFLIYIPTLSFEFTNWDDPVYVLTNRAIQTSGWSGIKQIFVRAIPASHGDYIPVTILSYWADFQLWGLRATGYHLSNVLLHVIGSCLLFLLVKRLTMRPVASMIVTLLFALHPMNSEAVTWIAERKSVMAMLWMLLSFHAFLNHDQRSKGYKIHYALSLLFYILACLSKTAVVFFPFLLLAHQFLLSRIGLMRSFFRSLPFLFIALLTAIGRVLGHFASGQMDWTPFETFLSHVSTVFEVFGEYVKNLIIPIGLNNSYPLEPSTNPFDPGPLFGLLCLAGMIVLIWRYFRAYPLICFGLIWYLAAWLPHSQIIPVPPALQADRYVYYSSAGLFLAFVAGAESLVMNAKGVLVSKGFKRSICVLGFLLIGVFASMTVVRNRVWSDSISLWSDSVMKYSQNPLAHCNLAMAYTEKGQADKAIEAYKRALAINDNNADAHNNLAGLYVQKRRFNDAISEYKKAIAVNGRLREARTNLGTVYAMKGRLDHAISEFQAALAIDPDHSKTHYYLGLAYSRKDMLREAIAEFHRAIATNPANMGAYIRLGLLLESQKKFKDAMAVYSRAIRARPNYYRAYINLARLYSTASDETLRNTKQAVKLAARACQLTGFRSTEALDTLEVALRERGDFKKAAEIRKRSSRLKELK